MAWGYAEWFALTIGVLLFIVLLVMFPRAAARRALGETVTKDRKIVRGQLQSWSPTSRLLYSQRQPIPALSDLERTVYDHVTGAVDETESSARPRRERYALRVRRVLLGVRETPSRVRRALDRGTLPQRLAVEGVLVLVFGVLAVAGPETVASMLPGGAPGIDPLDILQTAAQGLLDGLASLPGIEVLLALGLQALITSLQGFYDGFLVVALLLLGDAALIYWLDRRVSANEHVPDVRLIASRRMAGVWTAAAVVAGYVVGAAFYVVVSTVITDGVGRVVAVDPVGVREQVGLVGFMVGLTVTLAVGAFKLLEWWHRLRELEARMEHPVPRSVTARSITRVGGGVLGALAVPLLLLYVTSLIADGWLTVAANAVSRAVMVGVVTVSGLPETVLWAAVVPIGVGVGLVIAKLRSRIIRRLRAAGYVAAIRAAFGLDRSRTLLKSAPLGAMLAVGVLVGSLIGLQAGVAAGFGAWLLLSIVLRVHRRMSSDMTRFKEDFEEVAPFAAVRVGRMDDITTRTGTTLGVVDVNGTRLVNDNPEQLARDTARTIRSLLEDGTTPPVESEYWSERIWRGTIEREKVEKELRQQTRSEWPAVIGNERDFEDAIDELTDLFPPEYVYVTHKHLRKTGKVEHVGGKIRYLG